MPLSTVRQREALEKNRVPTDNYFVDELSLSSPRADAQTQSERVWKYYNRRGREGRELTYNLLMSEIVTYVIKSAVWLGLQVRDWIVSREQGKECGQDNSEREKFSFAF